MSASDERKENRAILEIEDASVTFDMQRGTSRVLNGVDMEIYEEEILGIVGESGSGKSMFASALLDAVVDPGVLSGRITYNPPDRESIDLVGLSDSEVKKVRWEEISMVFQGAMSSFNPTMKIEGHFKETLRAHDADVREGLAHARQLLRDLYLDPDRVLESYPHELSGGMRQRALIALSLVLKPNVLVMDEPTAALDLLMQQSILQLLEELQESYDLTVVFITHDLPLVAGLADRLAVLYAFEFVEVGPAGDIIEEPTHPYTRALLNSVPDLEGSLDSMRPITGASPDPVNIPTGCSYHPRCPLSDEQCRSVDPPMKTVDDGHAAACHYWEEAPDEIPLSLKSDQGESEVVVGEQSTDPVVSLDSVDIHFKEKSQGLLNMFEEDDTVHACDDIDLDIYENDVVAIVGESGCGKTTLGKTTIAAQEPTNGTVSYRGHDIWDVKRNGGEDISFEEIRKSLQIIHQDPGSSLNPNRTVRATLSVPLKKGEDDLNPDEREDRILSLLEYAGMTPPEDYASRYPHQLSGGEKQRVALIRAMFMNPDLILADEAVSALDVSLRVEMMDLMLQLQDRLNTSYVFISHDLANARYIAGRAGGRIAVMYLGEIVEMGPAEEIIRNPQHPYTKALKWSTAELELSEEEDEMPLRGIDIPDPIDPPSGCRFHTRCPEAKEVCARESPTNLEADIDEHEAKCFLLSDPDHEYWESPAYEPGDGLEVGSGEATASDRVSEAGD